MWELISWELILWELILWEVDLTGMNLYMLLIKYCCSNGTRRGEPHLTLNLGTIFPMLSDVVSSNLASFPGSCVGGDKSLGTRLVPTLLIYIYVLEGHSHLLASHIRSGKLDLLFPISARFLRDLPPHLSLLPSKQ